MALLRAADIVDSLAAVLAITTPFPAVVDVDMADDLRWEDLTPGLRHSANILRGKFKPTVDGGPVGEWEGVRRVSVGYVVDGRDPAARRARRDLAVPALEQLLAADRTLGLDPQVWAEIADVDEDDDRPVGDAAACSTVLIDIDVTYVAASAAG